MSKSPAFQWYPKDILASARVQEMSLAEEGAYRRLLDFCWLNGSIPADEKRCARLIGKEATAEMARVCLEMFTADPQDASRMIHDRLEEERRKQAANSQARRNASNARWSSRSGGSGSEAGGSGGKAVGSGGRAVGSGRGSSLTGGDGEAVGGSSSAGNGGEVVKDSGGNSSEAANGSSSSKGNAKAGQSVSKANPKGVQNPPGTGAGQMQNSSEAGARDMQNSYEEDEQVMQNSSETNSGHMQNPFEGDAQGMQSLSKTDANALQTDSFASAAAAAFSSDEENSGGGGGDLPVKSDGAATCRCLTAAATCRCQHGAHGKRRGNNGFCAWSPRETLDEYLLRKQLEYPEHDVRRVYADFIKKCGSFEYPNLKNTAWVFDKWLASQDVELAAGFGAGDNSGSAHAPQKNREEAALLLARKYGGVS